MITEIQLPELRDGVSVTLAPVPGDTFMKTLILSTLEYGTPWGGPAKAECSPEEDPLFNKFLVRKAREKTEKVQLRQN